MRYGYIRSATHDQDSINKQLEILKSYNLDEIVIELTGDDLKTLLQSLQPGDELHVVKLDRVTRSVNELISIIDMLESNNITLYQNGEVINDLKSFLPNSLIGVKETT